MLKVIVFTLFCGYKLSEASHLQDLNVTVTADVERLNNFTAQAAYLNQEAMKILLEFNHYYKNRFKPGAGLSSWRDKSIQALTDLNKKIIETKDSSEQIVLNYDGQSGLVAKLRSEVEKINFSTSNVWFRMNTTFSKLQAASSDQEITDVEGVLASSLVFSGFAINKWFITIRNGNITAAF